jgi:antitoxin MazE
MTTKIVQIGNSRGIRIPASLLKQYDFEGDVEIVAEADGLLLRQHQSIRAGWREAIEASDIVAANRKEDAAWLDAPLTDIDEWTW